MPESDTTKSTTTNYRVFLLFENIISRANVMRIGKSNTIYSNIHHVLKILRLLFEKTFPYFNGTKRTRHTFPGNLIFIIELFLTDKY